MAMKEFQAESKRLLDLMINSIYTHKAVSYTHLDVYKRQALNTAVEKLCDFAQKNQNRYIRFVKDVAAGAVLLSAVGALLAGVFILFRPELWRLLWGILGHPFSLGLLALSLALAAGFVFLGPAWVEERLDRLRHGK